MADYPRVTHPCATPDPEYCYPVSSVRLACLIHAASVRSEPESNSPLKSLHEPVFRPACKIIYPSGLVSTSPARFQAASAGQGLSHRTIRISRNRDPAGQLKTTKHSADCPFGQQPDCFSGLLRCVSGVAKNETFIERGSTRDKGFFKKCQDGIQMDLFMGLFCVFLTRKFFAIVPTFCPSIQFFMTAG